MKKLIVTGIIASLLLTVTFSMPIFWACCFAIDLFAKITGYSYYEANTILFLYVQPILVALTAVLGLIVMLYKTIKNTRWVNIILLGLYSIPILISKYIVDYAISEYWDMDKTDACYKAMEYLLHYRNGNNMGEYVFLNFAIFVFGFLAVIILNSYPLLVKSKTINKEALNPSI